jgi:hypothetical protein
MRVSKSYNVGVTTPTYAYVRDVNKGNSIPPIVREFLFLSNPSP